MAAGITERKRLVAGPGRLGPRRPGPDRVTVVLLGLTAFLLVLALLASQLASSQVKTAAHPALLVRRVYRTTIITTLRGGGGSGTSMSQSVSSSGSAGSSLPGPVTSSSH